MFDYPTVPDLVDYIYNQAVGLFCIIFAVVCFSSARTASSALALRVPCQMRPAEDDLAASRAVGGVASGDFSAMLAIAAWMMLVFGVALLHISKHCSRQYSSNLPKCMNKHIRKSSDPLQRTRSLLLQQERFVGAWGVSSIAWVLPCFEASHAGRYPGCFTNNAAQYKTVRITSQCRTERSVAQSCLLLSFRRHC